MGETTAMLESRLENEWQSPGQTLALRSEMLNELVRISRRLDAIESHPSMSVPPLAVSEPAANGGIELAKTRLAVAVEALERIKKGAYLPHETTPSDIARAALAELEAKP